MGPQGNIGTQTMGENRPQRLEERGARCTVRDTIIRESIPDCYADLGFRTTSTNPCGEIPLCPYDSCRLLALNLYSYVLNPFTSEAHFDFDTFSRHAQMAQRIMDDIVDLELEKIDGIIAKIDSDPQAEDVKYAERRLWEKIKKKDGHGTTHGRGHHCRGRHAGRLGTALWHAGGHRLCRQGAAHAGVERLPCVGDDGAGARRFLPSTTPSARRATHSSSASRRPTGPSMTTWCASADATSRA